MHNEDKKHFKMKKKRLIIPIVIIVALIIVFELYIYLKPGLSGNAILSNIFGKNKAVTQNANVPTGNVERIALTKETLPLYLQSLQMIKDMPKDSEILLKVYNPGTNVVEDTYVIRSGTVTKGTSDKPDVEINLNTNIIPELIDFCPRVKRAYNDGDITFSPKISNVQFLWKYKSMMKYQSCLM